MLKERGLLGNPAIDYASAVIKIRDEYDDEMVEGEAVEKDEGGEEKDSKDDLDHEMIIEPEIEMNIDDDESQENPQAEGDDEGRER